MLEFLALPLRLALQVRLAGWEILKHRTRCQAPYWITSQGCYRYPGGRHHVLVTLPSGMEIDCIREEELGVAPRYIMRDVVYPNLSFLTPEEIEYVKDRLRYYFSALPGCLWIVDIKENHAVVSFASRDTSTLDIAEYREAPGVRVLTSNGQRHLTIDYQGVCRNHNSYFSVRMVRKGVLDAMFLPGDYKESRAVIVTTDALLLLHTFDDRILNSKPTTLTQHTLFAVDVKGWLITCRFTDGSVIHMLSLI